MQISGNSGSLADYYLELMRQKTQKAGAPSAAADIFGATDSDGSGGVNSSEFASFLSQAGQASGASGVQGQAPASMPAGDIQAMFEDADNDGDGSLSLDEFTALSETMRPPAPGGEENAGSGVNIMAELMNLLRNSSASNGFPGLAGGSSASGGGFFELLKQADGSSASASSNASAYMQGLVKSAYGV